MNTPDESVAQPVSRTYAKDLLAVLTLSDADGARTTEDLFTGASQWQPSGRIYGGQALAQSVMAASLTVADDRDAHSLHGFFLRPGDIDLPITFAVERLRDGRSFSARRVHGYQNGSTIISVILSFQTRQDGLEHQAIELPRSISELPTPESLPSVEDELEESKLPADSFLSLDRPFDIRHIDPSVHFTPDPVSSPRQMVWVRAKSKVPADQKTQRAALAYASDFTLFEPVLRQHNLSWSTPGLSMASLDHAMWWHRPVDVNEWLLFVQDSPVSRGGRSMSELRILDQSGVLLASVAQEGMIRVPAPGSEKPPRS